MLAALWATPAAHARPALGVNIVDPFDPGVRAQVRTLGPQRVRVFLYARHHAAPYGPIDPAIVRAYRDFVDDMNASGIRVGFVVLSVPGGAANNHTSADPGVYADFMGRFATALRGTGSWFELWNEPDEEQFYLPQPSAHSYAALVKAAGAAIKRADPAATVVLGPLTGNNYEFLEALYSDGIKGSFDVAAVHTDTACLVNPPAKFYYEGKRIGRYSFLGYKEIRRTMLANGDDKPIWMTEFGWSSTGGGPQSCQNGVWAGQKPSGVSASAQATNLTAAVRCMSADPYLQAADWFTLRDAPGAPLDENRHFGLLGADGSPKPAYGQLFGLLRGTISASGSCADLTGPRVRIISPRAGQRLGRRLEIKVRVRDPSGLKRVRFYAGRVKFKAITSRRELAGGSVFRAVYARFARRSPGRVVIRVVAYDSLGNSGEQRVAVVKRG